ncbi:hypothetical protein [Oryza sativa Japonica Group]|uniref:Uncharacterized protein n=1 Tax=Oryza sativa subsp. japonica TaxID=39947 RepID=Q5ZAU6_ORYSJ|nr:hypothetical protein [Oryza sativa Japonica Group]BAD53281.1 hypothetical protein [Oryza sativa Japonica Group]
MSRGTISSGESRAQLPRWWGEIIKFFGGGLARDSAASLPSRLKLRVTGGI